MTTQVPPERLQAAEAALDRVRAVWLSRPGVTAVDVGLDALGQVSDEPVIRVHVADRPAPQEPFPEQLAGFAVRVVEGRYGLDEAGASGPHRDDREGV